MASWVLRMLPRNIRSLTTSSENQRVEDCHRHQEAYGYFLPIQTRWQDNDQYGHVNNVVYYSYFDTIINHYLISFQLISDDLPRWPGREQGAVCEQFVSRLKENRGADNGVQGETK
uniref:Thioesterase domain-containing protein n=1 Tax=Pipistrellus kuhlii TaxID=59472 RepID=A0A7J7X076_PIPKU|nr:hypothetical protein mPipKuh1_010742 [Pipistrellus kuhlii]